MACGLVPITNGVSAVPEFVEEENCIIAGSEVFLGMAEGIARLVESPNLFLSMSEAASQRVTKDRDIESVISQEILLIQRTAVEYTSKQKSA